MREEDESNGVRPRSGFDEPREPSRPLDLVLAFGLCVLSGLTVGCLMLIWCGR